MSEWTRLTPEGGENEGIWHEYRHYPDSHTVCEVAMCGATGNFRRSGQRAVYLSEPELLALVTVTGVWRQMPEVVALVDVCEKLDSSCDELQCRLDQADPEVIAAREHIDAAEIALAPFQEAK